MGRHASFGSPLATRQYRPQDGTDSSSSSEESDDGNSNDGGFGNRSRTYRRAQQAEPVVSREKRIKRSSEIDLSQSKIQEPLGLSPEFTSDEEAEQLASDDHELQQEQPASEDDPVVMEGEELSHPTGQTDNNEDEKSHKSYTGSDDDNATVDNSIRHPQTKHHDNSTEDLHADDSDVNKSHDERPSMSEASEAKKTRATGKPANKSRSGGTKKSPRKKGGRKR
ncbi:hypothetical protein EV182_006929 [Spiromyces aspiralis]|uniref:Uncharacterized protein n=1 Tax=Spiromyces aspiralis TaxID=68401 RepID=A0ACC1HRT9_9FUNG|nr:hypothetical protein EV182_006929 [Spiromyces aspiralis]